MSCGHWDKGYDLLRALGSAWHLVISDTRQRVPVVTGLGFCILCYQSPGRGYDLLRALGSASCVIRYETGGLRFVAGAGFCILCYQAPDRGVRFVTGLGFCILCYQTPDRGYDMLRALGSASCVIKHQTGCTICYRHWVLHLVLSITRQGVGFVTGIGFCILCYQTPDRGYDLLRALGSASWIIKHQTRGYDLLRAFGFASCVIRHETGGTICFGHWVLHLVLSDRRQEVQFVTGMGFCILCYQAPDRGQDLLRAFGSASCVIRHQTGGYDLLRALIRALDSAFCVIRHDTEDRICYGHRVLHLVLSDTRQGVRFVTGIGFCILCCQIRDRGYDLLRALGSASCVLRHQTGGTICYGAWVLHLVLSDNRQGVGFVTGIGFCILCYQTRNRGYDLLRALGSASCVTRHQTGVYDLLRALGSASCVIRYEIGGTICDGLCIMCYQTRDMGQDLLRALGSASCVIRHETEGTICYGHWVLHLVLSDTKQGVRFVTGIGFCILCYQTPDRGLRFVKGIGFCILCYQIRDRRYDL